MIVTSPLRYPGGKAKLFPFVTDLIAVNGLFGRHYAEPYAGGGGLAIKLLTTGFVDRITLNDIDPAIHAFWNAVLVETDAFVRRLEKTPVTVAEWRRQKAIWLDSKSHSRLELGFATYFLNRTSRSGILEGAGPIGGYEQIGNWKLDARLNKENQIANIRALSKFAPQIELACEDALQFFETLRADKNAILYLDPPYYVKGAKLYKNFYVHDDHILIASALRRRRSGTWILSYDDVPEIRQMYEAFKPISYRLQYSAGHSSSGKEVIYLSDSLRPPSTRGYELAA